MLFRSSTRTVYEASPLSRVKEQTASGVPMGSGVKQEYSINGFNDNVFWYVIDINNVLIINPTDPYYPPNTLNIIRTSDEDNKIVWEYRDRYNRVVLKRVDMSTGVNVYLDTYYVYDQKGSCGLCCSRSTN